MNSGRTEFSSDIFPRRRGGAESAQKKIVFGCCCGL